MAVPLPLSAISHVSRVVGDLEASRAFYRDILGFVEIKRPSSFDFPGSWLMGYGTAVHLIEGETEPQPTTINPKREHLSFQAENMAAVELQLTKQKIQFVKQSIMEDGIKVSQVFFHDPDGNMIEVCNCDELPVVLLEATATWGVRSAACPVSPTEKNAVTASLVVRSPPGGFFKGSGRKMVRAQSLMVPLRSIATAAA